MVASGSRIIAWDIQWNPRTQQSSEGDVTYDECARVVTPREYSLCLHSKRVFTFVDPHVFDRGNPVIQLQWIRRRSTLAMDVTRELLDHFL